MVQTIKRIQCDRVLQSLLAFYPIACIYNAREPLCFPHVAPGKEWRPGNEWRPGRCLTCPPARHAGCTEAAANFTLKLWAQRNRHSMAGHIVLLGDSIFDNASYVPNGDSVIEQLRTALPSPWQATLAAVDGARVASVSYQLERIPPSATHLFLSVGGNDALWTAGNVLPRKSQDVRGALDQVGRACAEFAQAYVQLVSKLREHGLPVVLCTIYDAIPGLGPAELAGLCLFNDTITRTAFEQRLTLLDLRLICNQASDYSDFSPIEPSTQGGSKIVFAILQAAVENRNTSGVIV